MGCSSSAPKATKYCKPGEYTAPAKDRAGAARRRRPPPTKPVARKASMEKNPAGSAKPGKFVGFHAKYKSGKMLGEGAFSKVYYCENRKTGEPFACKIVERRDLPPDDERALLSEVDILRTIDSPFVIKCVDFFDEADTIYVVLEYIAGGELFDRIVKKTVYNEADARLLVHTILLAVKVCHDQRVVHRDLKPENLLLKSQTDDSDVVVADFGFAAVAENDHCLCDACGTPGYVAPEILQGALYGRPADMWSVGVITFILLGGYPPFYDNEQKSLFRKIKAGRFEFHPQYWKGVSNEAKDLIRGLLTVDPSRRSTAEQALAHPWLRITDAALAGHNLNDQLLELRKFNARRKFRAAVKAIVTVNSLRRRLPSLSVAVSTRAILSHSGRSLVSTRKLVQYSMQSLMREQASSSRKILENDHKNISVDLDFNRDDAKKDLGSPRVKEEKESRKAESLIQPEGVVKI